VATVLPHFVPTCNSLLLCHPPSPAQPQTQVLSRCRPAQSQCRICRPHRPPQDLLE
jgi:hypothetical protein